MKSTEPAIKVENLHKSFKLPHQKNSSLKSSFISKAQSGDNKGYEMQHVLKGVDFEINQGEFFGIVGRNGSGKSTLLKCLARIYYADKGSIKINGELTPFIELGVGFNQELTGRDNVYLNGALLGFSRPEMDSLYNGIVEFAELESFMDQKLKNYSSGMQVRLAFSIAIQTNAEILLLDEVLAVGDSAFQQKCYDYFSKLKVQKKTIILVSHSMSAVERFCDRALLLEEGIIKGIGQSGDIATMYEEMFASDKASEGTGKATKKKKNATVDIKITQDGKESSAVVAKKAFKLTVEVLGHKNIKGINLGVNIRNSANDIVFANNVKILEDATVDLVKDKKIIVNFDIDNYYTNGEYMVDVALVNDLNAGDKIIYKEKNLITFNVFGITHHAHSLFHPPATAEIIESSDKETD